MGFNLKKYDDDGSFLKNIKEAIHFWLQSNFIMPDKYKVLL